MKPVSLGVRLLAALSLVATGLVLQSSTPATAAGCSGSTGVTVVVDHHQLGGGVQQACDADGGGKAASTVFPDSGFALTYVQRQPGFVCRIAGAPSSDPCVNTPPAGAYWSLWWSDGKSGTWTYSSTGVGSLTVPDGGYLAFSWQGQDGKAAPGVSPAPRAAPSSPSPSPSAGDSGGGDGPSPGGTKPGSGGGTRSGGGSTPTPGEATPAPGTSTGPEAAGTPDAGPGEPGRPGRSGGARQSSATPSPTGSPSESAGALSADSPPSGGERQSAGEAADGDGLPVWVSVLAVGALLTGAAAAAAIRARRTPS